MRFLAVLCALFILSSCSEEENTPASVSLEDFRGKWVVVNYWAIWCKPCIEEIPELNRLNSQFDQVVVVGVNYDGVTGSELAQQLADLDVQFPTLDADPSFELGIARPLVLPTTIILDPQGVVTGTLVGPQTAASLAAVTEQASADVLNERE